jgi:hypothetical protein
MTNIINAFKVTAQIYEWAQCCNVGGSWIKTFSVYFLFGYTGKKITPDSAIFWLHVKTLLPSSCQHTASFSFKKKNYMHS